MSREAVPLTPPVAPMVQDARPAQSLNVGAPDLPKPLDDPMRLLRTFLGWAALAQLCAAPVLVLGSDSPLLGKVVVALGALLFFSAPYSWAVWRILPRCDVDLLYLRSFRSDRETSAIRYDIQKAIGRRLRVSGIRDPRRRWPRVLRFTFLYAFALRYSTPRYLNLEAESDWKLRLWRSLSLARGAIIDISDLTPYVAARSEEH